MTTSMLVALSFSTADARGPAISAPAPSGVLVRTTGESIVLPAPAVVGQAATLNISVRSTFDANAQLATDLVVTREVLSVAPDGSYVVRTHLSDLTVTQTPPGFDVSALDGLNGLAMQQTISAAGVPLSDPQVIGTVTEQQMAAGARLISWFSPAAVGFPGGPVAIGSSWVAAGTAGSPSGVVVPVTYHCRLASADDTTYSLEVSYAQDFDVTADTTGQMVGTISGQGTIKGSRSHPLVTEGSITQSTDGVQMMGTASTPVTVATHVTMTTVSTVG